MKRLLLSLMLLLGAAAAQAQSTDKPLLLVASPGLEGPYGHTALIAVPLADRHIGFIVNRRTELTLAVLFPAHAASAKVTDPLYFGGPEMIGAVFAVVRGDPGSGALPLFDGLYLGATEEVVDRVIERSPEAARFFAGFVAWQPGELDAELEAGYWYAADADAGLFFRKDVSEVWEELIERLGNGPQRATGFRATSF